MLYSGYRIPFSGHGMPECMCYSGYRIPECMHVLQWVRDSRMHACVTVGTGFPNACLQWLQVLSWFALFLFFRDFQLV